MTKHVATSGTATLAARAPGSGFVGLIIKVLRVREAAMVILIAVICLIMSIVSPYFFSVTNFLSIARGFSMEGMVTIGMTLLLITGAFDLSVGAVMALSGIVTASMIVSMHMPYSVAFAGGLGVGVLVGLINGLLVTKLKVNALIATLGMMTITRGIALGITEGSPVVNVPLGFAWLGQGSLFGIPIPFIILVAMVIVADILLRRGRTLRQLYYIGGNQKAARFSGIQVDRIILLTFIGSGLAAALGGIITTARLTSGIPTAFAGVEMRVIAACVIGGASLSGGEGTIVGAMLGLVFMALVSNSMTMLGVSVYWEGVVTGIILIFAVAMDMLSRRRM